MRLASPGYRMKSLHILFIAAVLTAVTAQRFSALAGGAPVQPKDASAVEACLRLAQKIEDARGTHEPDELAEEPGPAGRLSAAREAAMGEAGNCLGVVATACIQAEGNMSASVLVSCYARERDVWDARLNAAYKKVLASAEGEDVADGFRKVQRAWIAFRDASCAQPAIFFKGTMAVPMEAYCVMKMTAQQALWLEAYLP